MIELKQGDVFAVASKSWMAKAINAVSGWNAADGKSSYNHAGIICDAEGRTFEALRRLDFYHLDAYKGRSIIIARPDAPKDAKHTALLKVVYLHRGQIYPAWRIPLHIYPPLARKISINGKYLVCSEAVAKYEWLTGTRHPPYTGATPDMLADEWRQWRSFNIIYEGVWA
jgi:hypothetical protein